MLAFTGNLLGSIPAIGVRQLETCLLESEWAGAKEGSDPFLRWDAQFITVNRFLYKQGDIETGKPHHAPIQDAATRVTDTCMAETTTLGGSGAMSAQVSMLGSAISTVSRCQHPLQ